MQALGLLLTAVATVGSAAPMRPAWDKIFDGGRGRDVSLVAATGRNDWVAAGGRWGLATSRGGTVHIDDTHGHGVLGFFKEAPGSLYALGEGELIWHFDGQTWKEEHVAPMPPRGRGPSGDHMLYVGYMDAQAATPVAVGLALAFVRLPDGTWSLPDRPQRDKLRDAGLLGPAFPAPARCQRGEWRWFGPHRGAFACHDRRAFVWAAGVITPKGRLPGPCDVVGALIEVRGELYASCHATLWKTDGDTWHRIAGPNDKTLKEDAALSFADGCLFVGGGNAVWRTCERPGVPTAVRP